MNLSTKVFAGFVLISFIFTTVAIVNFRLSEDVIENGTWVDRSQAVIRDAARLQRNIIDMENGFRGYLLTGDPAFLKPYLEAEQQLPFQFADLLKQVIASPVQQLQVDSIKNIHSRWKDHFAAGLIAEKNQDSLRRETGVNHLPSSQMLFNGFGKQKTDSIRNIFKGFNALEYRIRESRNKKLNDSIWQTRRLSTAFTLLSVILGLGWAWYITRLISRRISRMVQLADKISKGDYQIQIDDRAHDELSKLSASLDLMASTIYNSFSELDRKNKELDQFAYVVSHDLKAPLRGIETASRWVEEDMGKSLPAHVQEYLRMMRIRVGRMENLINGILALSRIGRTKQAEEEVDVREVLQETLDLLDPPPSFQVYLPEHLPVVRTVRVELQQVFSNLINNAIKYHHRPEGLISIGYAESEDFHEFSVTDDGPGIDPEYHNRIFVIFQTLQERDAVESTGVGLSIVKKIVERQGGSIWVSSALGQGSTFTFTLPKLNLLPENKEAEALLV